MPDLLSIGAGIAEGFEKASTNLFNITLAKHKLLQEKEQTDLDKKISKLKLQKAEYDISPDVIERERKTQDLDFKVKEAQLKKAESDITIAEAEQKQKAEGAANALRLINSLTSGGNIQNMDINSITNLPEVEAGMASGQQVAANINPDLYEAPAQSGSLGLPPEMSATFKIGDAGSVTMKGKEEPDVREKMRQKIMEKYEKGEPLSPMEEKILSGFSPGTSGDTFTDFVNAFDQAAPGAAKPGTGGDMRQRAIEALKNAGEPVVEENIKEVMRQLRGQ